MNENERTAINGPGSEAAPDSEMAGMEEGSFNRHYIRVDERSRVVYAFSDEFGLPRETDILINEKGGRHFRLVLDGAPTHENPIEMMFDGNGVPLLKWDAKAKKIVRRAEKEILADIEAGKPPLEARQKEAVMRTHMILVEALQVPIEHEGRLFSVTKEKQTLLAKQISMWMVSKQFGEPIQLNWNATGEVCEPWEFPDLFRLASAMTNHVEPLVKMQREAEVKIIRAKNEEEVTGHVERFRDDILAIVGR